MMFLSEVIVIANRSKREATLSPQVGEEHSPLENSFKTKMRRLEPRFQTMGERVAHHVKSSWSRATILRARMQDFLELDHDSGYQSKMTAVPGGYAMSISLGSPPQEFMVIADTGSDLTWVQASACDACFSQASDPYDQDKSSTYQSLSCPSYMCNALGTQAQCSDDEDEDGLCQYAYQYGDNSVTEGNFSTETITLQNTDGEMLAVPNFAFGVGLHNSVDFYGVDGLVGLGQGPISFPSQLGKQYGNVFSYCLQSIFSDPTTSSPVIFGRSALPTSENVQYTALQTSENKRIPTFWFLNLIGVRLNNKMVNVDSEQSLIAGGEIGEQSMIIAAQSPMGTVIDSGTTITMLDPRVYLTLARMVETRVKYSRTSSQVSGLDLCFDVGNDRDPDLPGLTLIFQDQSWDLPKVNVFVPVDELAQIWCLAVIPTNQGIQIIGNLQQQNFQMIYDQPNARIGWIPSNCESI
ncbi:hypothetical protein AXG93_2958s1120 [Marchantia polymorpha subsp. ruderalis]|uniref:Peptidase A1 domain-containing protein n=1 Tax=Marchantia polymorpha subsp. ruderalis TaxID=1480154 RepID=A0A176VGM3_MARPO|nr:hypothetical protein AXG93_2958s1120 [Marchantia polymorpha subsp. ruderalis]